MIFGRMVRFDERSRKYPVRKLFKTSKPRSYTWRCDTVLDQGSDGSCVGHAWAHELIARPSPVKDITHDIAKEIIYWTAQKLDPWEGGSYPGAKPFYEGSSVLAGAEATMTTGLIGGYRWAFGLDDLIMGIGYHGPAVIGINWYNGMSNPDKDGMIKVSGSLAGGHAILVNGVNIKKGICRLHNSWGNGWGLNGECFISFEDMDRLLKEDGEAVFATGRRKRMAQR